MLIIKVSVVAVFLLLSFSNLALSFYNFVFQCFSITMHNAHTKYTIHYTLVHNYRTISNINSLFLIPTNFYRVNFFFLSKFKHFTVILESMCTWKVFHFKYFCFFYLLHWNWPTIKKKISFLCYFNIRHPKLGFDLTIGKSVFKCVFCHWAHCVHIHKSKSKQHEAWTI